MINDTSLITPRLWFDLGYNQNPDVLNQNDCDCDCACPTHIIALDGSIKKFATFQNSLKDNTIKELYLCDETFSTDLQGFTLALNAQGKHLLVGNTYLRSVLSSAPCSVKTLREKFPEIPEVIFEKTIALLLGMRLLTTPSIPETPTWDRPNQDVLVTYLSLTNRCQLRCLYCYIPKKQQDMDVATAEHSVQAIFRSAATHNYKRIKLKYAGGEPTLNFEAIVAAQEQAEMLSRETGILSENWLLTNGIHITDSQIEFLLAHNIYPTISLDGLGLFHEKQRPSSFTEQHSFRLTKRTIERFMDAGCSPHVSITLTKLNLEGLPELVEYLLKHELHFNFNFYRPPSDTTSTDPLNFTSTELLTSLEKTFTVIEKNLPQYNLLASLADRANLQILHERTCGVGQNYMVIDCQGNISKCQMEMHRSYATISDHDPLTLLRSSSGGVQNPHIDDKDCQKCLWRYRCTGGCPRLAFQYTGQYTAKSPFCDIYQNIFPKILRLEGLRLLKYENPWNFSSLMN